MGLTKIVCTIGLASNSSEVIRGMIEAGMDVARINFSHGTHEEHAQIVKEIRNIASELDRNIAILSVHRQGVQGVIHKGSDKNKGSSLLLAHLFSAPRICSYRWAPSPLPPSCACIRPIALLTAE